MTATNPHTKSDRSFSPKPHLWVSNPDLAPELREFFRVCTSTDEPNDGARHHILALDTELETRQLARKLGVENVKVMCFDGNLAAYLIAKGEDALYDLMTEGVRYGLWLELLLDKRLTLTEAEPIIRDVLENVEGSERTKELEPLSIRYVKSTPGGSGYKFDQFIKKLEAEIHASVDGRSSTHPEIGELRRSHGRYKQRYHAIDEFWGSKLRFNTLKQRVELDGEPLDLDFVRPTLCVELDIDIPKEEAVEIVLTLARKNSYCPIAEYLERVEATHSESGINFDSLAKYLLGSDDPLHAIYLKRHLIGSVARALNPGCQMDTALILQGIQGIGKSSFFRALYGDEFFDDTMAEASDKDELMKLHQHWAVEWAEFETQLSRKGYSRLKQFMTTKVDNYRPPYGRTSKSFRRHTVLVGSTNEKEFLTDPSGDRRYWVLPVKSKIDTAKTAELRDSIWATACKAHRSGEQWWLTEQEKELAKKANEPFRGEDVWTDPIWNHICDRSFVTIGELLSEPLEIEVGRQTKGDQMRVSNILTRLGWQKGKTWVNGTWKRGWTCPDRSTDPPFTPLEGGGSVGGSVLEHRETETFGDTDPPDPPFTSNSAELVGLVEEVTAAETEKSLDQGGSGGSVESLNACKSVVSPTDPPSEDLVGWEERHQKVSYPNPKSDNVRSSQKRALAIRAAYRAARCQSDLSNLRKDNGGEFSKQELVWVSNWLKQCFPAEHQHMKATANVVQGNLLE